MRIQNLRAPAGGVALTILAIFLPGCGEGPSAVGASSGIVSGTSGVAHGSSGSSGSSGLSGDSGTTTVPPGVSLPTASAAQLANMRISLQSVSQPTNVSQSTAEGDATTDVPGTVASSADLVRFQDYGPNPPLNAVAWAITLTGPDGQPPLMPSSKGPIAAEFEVAFINAETRTLMRAISASASPLAASPSSGSP